MLSIPEANKYFSSDSARQCEPTNYAVASGAAYNFNGNCLWWLRSPGNYQNFAADVHSGDGVNERGYGVFSDVNAVRPALWIELGT